MFSNIWPVMLSFRPGMMSILTPVVRVQRKDGFIADRSIFIVFRHSLIKDSYVHNVIKRQFRKEIDCVIQ